MKRTRLERRTGLARVPFQREAVENRHNRRTAARKTQRNTNAPRAVEKLVLHRAQKHCEICGAYLAGERGRDWSLHHRMSRSLGGSRDPQVVASAANLIAICGDGVTKCHGGVESAPKHYTLAPGDDGRKIRRGQWSPAEVPVVLRYGWVLLDEHGRWVKAEPGQEAS